MTREEAIEMVKLAFEAWELEFSIRDEALESEFGIGDDWSKEHEAIGIAIKALEFVDKMHQLRLDYNDYKISQDERIKAEADLFKEMGI